MKHLILLSVAALLAGGCCSKTESKPTVQRGWIGGEYDTAKRSVVPKGQSSRVYVKQIYPETPAEQAQLKPGDLVMALNGQTVADLKEFRRLVEIATPGSWGKIQVFRAGESLELPITIGRETFKQWHTLTMGLGVSSHVDLLPDPNFQLLPLARYKVSRDRVELRSPEVMLAKAAGKEDSQDETGARSDEGWDAWFLLFGVGAHKRIIAQEIVPATTALRTQAEY